MAGLYDRIRKTKLKNLEAVLEAEQARSMAEAVAKFKNVNSQSAYGGGEALADPAAALGGGKQIKETSQDNPCEPDGAGGMINKNTGKPCKSLEEMTESDPDVNPDADEDGGGLFGRKKGGTKIGNFLRNIVGKKSYELMDADPFSSALKSNGEIDIENLEGKEGTAGGQGGAYGESGPSTVNIGGQNYDVDLNTKDDQDIQDPKKKKFQDACSEEYIAENGPEACDKWKSENDRCGKLIAEGATSEQLKEAGCSGFDPVNQREDCAATYGEGYVFDEASGKCVKGDLSASGNLTPREDEIKRDPEASNTMTWGSQLLTNWGQNLQQGRQKRIEGKDAAETKRGFTKNQQALYNEARKSLRKKGDLPGRADRYARQEAIFAEMNRLNALRPEETRLEGNWGGAGHEVGGVKMPISEIARQIREGKLDYRNEDIAKLPFEVRQKIRDLSDSTTDQGGQYSDKVDKKVADTSEGALDAQLDEIGAPRTNKAAFLDWVKNNPEKVQDLNVDEITNALPDKNLKTKFSPAFNSSTVMKKKPNHFNMKRGKLNRPGY